MSSAACRRWSRGIGLTLVFVCFCSPLFVGLGGRDLGNDEAIYSYAALRIVQTQDWLTPRAIPFDGPFLEKPPLKFWMIAAPIALGLLPPDEFGLRVLDAALGALAFVYVFLLGRWQSGAVGGMAAVLVLYTIEPLTFALRSNTMEAPLLLCYAGGVYHFARWVDAGGARSAGWHRLAVAIYFAIGFLTKFVAILFLPLICLAAVVVRRDRGPLLRSLGRAWIGPAILGLTIIAPWFVYQTVHSGRLVWDVMLGQHVYTRFTGSLDASHLHPWHHYVSTLWQQLENAGSQWLVLAGAAALAAAGCGRSGWLARVFLVWALVPIGLLSLGSSKLLHYILPFLPPLALGAGYISSLVFNAATALLAAYTTPWAGRWLPWSRDATRSQTRTPTWMEPVRLAVMGLAGVAAITGLVTALTGRLLWTVGEVEIFRNSSVLRPFVIGALLFAIAGELRWAARSLVAPLLLMIMPLTAYQDGLKRTTTIDRPLRAARDCLVDVRRSGAAVAHTVYNAAPAMTYHSYNYYLRDFEPWVRTSTPDPSELRRRLVEAGAQSPVLISELDYIRVALPAIDQDAGRINLVGFSADPGLVALMPGAFARCAPAAVEAGAKPVGFASEWEHVP
jgi:4-amino-4-deoxy-L-arabinose transferase-like glycosyltransferase